MSAPMIWIAIPGAAALLLYLLRRWERSIHIAGLFIALTLAWLAWQTPIEKAISLGFPGLPPLKLISTVTLFGRRLVVADNLRPALVLTYLGISLWFLGAYAAGVHRLFIPLGLGIASLLVASLAIDPVMYAVMMVEIAALVSVGILSPPGKPVRSGVLRFLSFQTIGMCLVLFANFLLEAAQAKESGAALVNPSMILFSLGIALAAGIFPFHTWIPMLAEQAHPYAAAFVVFFIPLAVAFIGLDYLALYSPLEIYTQIQTNLFAAGVLMVLVGGVFAVFQNNLGRIMGYAAISQIGMGVLALALGSQVGTDSPLKSLFFAQLIPQGLGLAVWALALACLQQSEAELRFRKIQGIAQRMPVASFSLVAANFSLAGMPLFASFPIYSALWSALTERSLPVALLSLVGNALLFAAGVRTLAVLVTGPGEEGWRISERSFQALLLISGCALLLILGMAPYAYLPLISKIGLIFSGAGP